MTETLDAGKLAVLLRCSRDQAMAEIDAYGGRVTGACDPAAMAARLLHGLAGTPFNLDA